MNCLYPELLNSEERVGPWGAEMPVPRVEDASCKVRWPAIQMQSTQTTLPSFQNSPLDVTVDLTPEPAFHFWLYYEPWGVLTASSPPQPLLCWRANASTVPTGTLPVCINLLHLHHLQTLGPLLNCLYLPAKPMSPKLEGCGYILSSTIFPSLLS